jgi:penicillin amidase
MAMTSADTAAGRSRPWRSARRVGARLLTGLVAVVLLLLILSATTVVLLLRSPFPRTGGTLRISGLSAAVTVYRDEHGIPQIYADTAEDLFRAQGYVHAQDRFWEMDFRRHVTSGRLAELFGPDQVDTDKFLRVMGWRRIAEQEYSQLPAREKGWFDAYAAGVNAYLADRSPREIGVQYALLRVSGGPTTIEHWDPVDSLAWLKAMAWDLSGNVTEELNRARLVAAGLPADRVEQLYPPYPYDLHRPIVEQGTVVGDRYDQNGGVPTGGRSAGAGPQPAQPLAQSPAQPPVLPAGAERALAAAAAAVTAAVPTLDAVLGPKGRGIGSNSFVISGARTRTGHPILANDPHLAGAMPSIWYQVGLHCTRAGDSCPFDVAGFSFSGTPGVVIGHNNRIAWGFTNLGTDVEDLYVEHVNGDSYDVAGERRPMTVRQERITVAGGDPVTLTVRSTEHGPLLSDVAESYRDATSAPLAAAGPAPITPGTRQYAVSLRWTALTPGTTAQSIFALDAAHDWQSFRQAARLFAVPAQNIVYADVDGHIGYQAPGDVPIRGRGDGRWPVPGWDPAYGWTRSVPFDALPSVLDPRDGFVATANQAVVGPQYPYQLTADWSYGYRSQRLVDLIQAGGRISLDQAQAFQLDKRNGNAADLVPALQRINLPADSSAARARRLFDGWDLQQPVDSAAAAFFNATWRQLMVRLVDDEVPAELRTNGNDRFFEFVREQLSQPDSPWWDDRRTTATEHRDDTLGEAMRAAADELTVLLGADPTGWRWGDLHTLTIRDSTFGNSGVGPIEWLVNRGPYPLGGGESIVDATGWTTYVGYQVDWLPSMRMIVDLGDLDASRWINLTGESGHPFHPNYNDQFPLWRDGRTLPMTWDRRKVEQAARSTLRLTPP